MKNIQESLGEKSSLERKIVGKIRKRDRKKRKDSAIVSCPIL